GRGGAPLLQPGGAGAGEPPPLAGGYGGGGAAPLGRVEGRTYAHRLARVAHAAVVHLRLRGVAYRVGGTAAARNGHGGGDISLGRPHAPRRRRPTRAWPPRSAAGADRAGAGCAGRGGGAGRGAG